MNKKAQIGKKIDTAVVLIVSVVVLFLVFAAIVPEAQTAGDAMSDDTICVNTGCVVNNTLTPSCQSNLSPQGFGANSSGACPFALQNIPLSGLFGGSGVVILLLMVFLFLGVLKMVMPKSKK